MKKEFLKETIRYLIVGAITTLLSILFLWLLNDLVGLEKNISNIISNAITIIIAYVLNRIFVFKSDNNILMESSKFIISRVLVAIIDEILFFLLSMIISNVIVVKVIVNIVVIILNYIFSKLVVFKAPKSDKNV